MNISARINIFSRISKKDIIFFTRQMAVMYKSGIPISDAISGIAKQTKNSSFQKVLNSVYQSIVNGQSLETALSKFPNVFNSFYIYMIRVGEKSGTLEEVLKRLALQLRKEDEFRKKVISASLYPALVIGTAIVVSMGISLFVLPKLIDLFQSLDVKLPITTQILIFVATIMRDYGILIFSILGLLALIIVLLIRIPKVKMAWEKIWMSMPVIGEFMQNIETSQFCRNLGIMVQSGLPISEALDTQEKATSNLVYRKYASEIEEGVTNGQSITKVLDTKKYRFFPEIAVRMIEVGEKTGKLDDSLLYLGDFFEEEVDNTAKNLSTTLEPILLLIIGLIVAFLALAIITPIYQFTGSIHN